MECGAIFRTASGGVAICRRPPGHPSVPRDGIGHDTRPQPEAPPLPAAHAQIVHQALSAARSAMEVGKDTRNAYGSGALDALERLAQRLGVTPAAYTPEAPATEGD